MNVAGCTADELLDIITEVDERVDHVTTFEAEFIDNMLQTRPRHFTSKQVEVIQQMGDKYLW